MSTASPSDAARIAELEARVAELTEAEAPKSSRRSMLRLAGAAAAGAAAVAVAGKASPVAAADGDPLIAGGTVQTTAASRETTDLVYTNTATPQVPGVLIGSTQPANIFTVRDTPGGIIFIGDASNSSYPAAVGGYSYRTVANGVYGYTSAGGGGAGVVGWGNGDGTVGVIARGDRANAYLFPDGDAGPARTDAHVVGDLIADEDGGLWYCTASGTPGTFVSLTTGKFHAITPSRVYDSRSAQPSSGPLAAGANRNLSIKDKRDLSTGAVTTADIVPEGATAITANVTVVNTVGSGFLAVNPGGTTEVSAATVNWFGPNQILNNGVNITINPATREVTVVAGGSGGAQTDFVIDVTGYFR